MATYIPNPADLVGGIAYQNLHKTASRNSGLATVAAKAKERSTTQDAKDNDPIFHSLIASGVQPRRNPWASFGAVVFQSLLLLAVIVIPLYHTEILPKRYTLTMLYAPPPAAGSGAVRLSAPRAIAQPTPSSTSIALPSQQPKAQEAAPAPVSTTTAMVGGVPGGVVGGVEGGVPGGTFGNVLSSTYSAPVLAKAPESMPKRVRLAQRIVEANLIHDVAPVYPPEAGRARIQGNVVLLAVIGKDGTVQDVRVESGLPILVQAAIDAVKQWRYKPYLLNGEPVEVDSRITINFTLS